MPGGSRVEKTSESSHEEIKRGAVKPARYWLRQALSIASVILASLLLTIVAFRVVNPISPIGVAEMLGIVRHNRPLLPLEKMSPDLPLAVIASEDGRFCNHWGVDWAAMRDAINQGGGKIRGASTIPMQLAKNLYLWPQRSYWRKMLEVPTAHLISALWSKKVVMETYLNVAPWGPVVGAEEASHYYFKKSTADLTRHEAILMAVALPNPSVRNPAKPSPRTLRIARAVEQRMPVLASRSGCVLSKSLKVRSHRSASIELSIER